MNKKVQNLAKKDALAELKSRLWFVLLALVVYRIGAHVPVPGIDPAKLASFFESQKDTILGLFNMFSGGALQRLTVFALNVMPYISASIIIQLMTVVVPTLEELRKEGESGRRKINQYTRYLTVIIATVQGLGMAQYLLVSGFTLYHGLGFYVTTTVTLVTGTMFLMWLGEQMTERGVGNGISLIITAGIIAGIPSALGRTFEQVREGQILPVMLIVLLAVVLAVVAFVVFVERGQRKITVNYAKRQQGRRLMSAPSTHLPFKINMAGVIPPIFANSIMLFPATIAKWFSNDNSFLVGLSTMLAPMQGQPLYILLFSIAIIFFAFFYTALMYNPRETADNLKKSGAFIPGIRPGEQTARYIDGVMTRLTGAGSIYLLAICLMPELMNLVWHIPFYLGGTSLLIIVVVLMDFMAQVQTHLMGQQYEALMKKAHLKSNKI